MSDINPGVQRVNAWIQAVDDFEVFPEENTEALDAQSARRAALAMEDPNSICALIMQAGLARLIQEAKEDGVMMFDGGVPYQESEDAVTTVIVDDISDARCTAKVFEKLPDVSVCKENERVTSICSVEAIEEEQGEAIRDERKEEGVEEQEGQDVVQEGEDKEMNHQEEDEKESKAELGEQDESGQEAGQEEKGHEVLGEGGDEGGKKAGVEDFTKTKCECKVKGDGELKQDKVKGLEMDGHGETGGVQKEGDENAEVDDLRKIKPQGKAKGDRELQQEQMMNSEMEDQEKEGLGQVEEKGDEQGDKMAEVEDLTKMEPEGKEKGEVDMQQDKINDLEKEDQGEKWVEQVEANGDEQKQAGEKGEAGDLAKIKPKGENGDEELQKGQMKDFKIENQYEVWDKVEAGRDGVLQEKVEVDTTEMGKPDCKENENVELQMEQMKDLKIENLDQGQDKIEVGGNRLPQDELQVEATEMIKKMKVEDQTEKNQEESEKDEDSSELGREEVDMKNLDTEEFNEETATHKEEGILPEKCKDTAEKCRAKDQEKQDFSINTDIVTEDDATMKTPSNDLMITDNVHPHPSEGFIPQSTCKDTCSVEITPKTKKRGFLTRIFSRRTSKKDKRTKVKRVEIEDKLEKQKKKPSKLTALIFACCCVQPMDLQRVNAWIQAVDDFEVFPEENTQALDAQSARRAALAMEDPNSICALIMQAGLARLIQEAKEDSMVTFDGGVPYQGSEDAVTTVIVDDINDGRCTAKVFEKCVEEQEGQDVIQEGEAEEVNHQVKDEKDEKAELEGQDVSVPEEKGGGSEVHGVRGHELEKEGDKKEGVEDFTKIKHEGKGNGDGELNQEKVKDLEIEDQEKERAAQLEEKGDEQKPGDKMAKVEDFTKMEHEGKEKGDEEMQQDKIKYLEEEREERGVEQVEEKGDMQKQAGENAEAGDLTKIQTEVNWNGDGELQKEEMKDLKIEHQNEDRDKVEAGWDGVPQEEVEIDATEIEKKKVEVEKEKQNQEASEKDEKSNEIVGEEVHVEYRKEGEGEAVVKEDGDQKDDKKNGLKEVQGGMEENKEVAVGGRKDWETRMTEDLEDKQLEVTEQEAGLVAREENAKEDGNPKMEKVMTGDNNKGKRDGIQEEGEMDLAKEQEKMETLETKELNEKTATHKEEQDIRQEVCKDTAEEDNAKDTYSEEICPKTKKRSFLARIFSRRTSKKEKKTKMEMVEIGDNVKKQKKKPSKFTALIFACCCVQPMD
ncbi:neurofilament medium polypeptide-like [Patiria miniata]|uniref:Uncharacterized protein n=1 Tax=Patiria miniata TaxID=46514 RepID=A0A913Z6Z9_PATMI|nr:neurofilament medium polypeptide-like [Patiria miniata]